jgi:hypothetical protein
LENYSVKQISEMLETNPETVRRWIRTGKLKAQKESNKDGNIISQAELVAFIKSFPKYASIAAISFGISPFGFIAGTALIASLIMNDNTKSNNQDHASTIIFLKQEIGKFEKSVLLKRNRILHLEKEILSQVDKIDVLKKRLKILTNSMKGEK